MVYSGVAQLLGVPVHLLGGPAKGFIKARTEAYESYGIPTTPPLMLEQLATKMV
jgi:hypothetical protein